MIQMDSPLFLKKETVVGGRYVIDRVIRNKENFITYLAGDTELNRSVELKELFPNTLVTRAVDQKTVLVDETAAEGFWEKEKADFREQAQSMIRPEEIGQIQKLYTVFYDNNTVYQVMEHPEGQPLSELLEEKRGMEEEQAFRIMKPVLEGIRKLHEQGIAHGNLSPDCIYVKMDTAGKADVKITDLESVNKDHFLPAGSRSLTVLMKEGYTPEERYRSAGDVEPVGDIYALGAVYYRLLTGIDPVSSWHRRLEIEDGKKDPLLKCRRYGRHISARTDKAVWNALAIKADNRTSNVETFLAELQEETHTSYRKQLIRAVNITRWPMGAKIGAMVLGLTALSVLLAAALSAYSAPENGDVLPDGMIRVPDFVSADLAWAEEKAMERKLLLSYEESVYMPGGTANTVLWQNVVYGTLLPENSAVSVGISQEEQEFVMPDLLGLPEEIALEQLDFADLDIEIRDEHRAGVAEDCVVLQEPVAFENIGNGSRVILAVNRVEEDTSGIAGKEADVPEQISEAEDSEKRSSESMVSESESISGKTLEEAWEAAAREGAVCSVSEKRWEDNKEGNTVLVCVEGEENQWILTVSLETRTMSMPDLSYMSIDKAERILRNMGLKSRIEHSYHEAVREGCIYGQDTNKGQSITTGQKVVLFASDGRPPFVMPDLRDMEEREALAVIDQLQLAVSVSYDFDEKHLVGTVISQDPKQGNSVRKGDTIHLVICSNQVLVELEDFVGQDPEAARRKLEEAGFQVQVEEVTGDSGQDNTIIRQYPEGGTKQKKGTVVILTVNKRTDRSQNTLSREDGQNEQSGNGSSAATPGNTTTPSTSTPQPTRTPAAAAQPTPSADPSAGQGNGQNSDSKVTPEPTKALLELPVDSQDQGGGSQGNNDAPADTQQNETPLVCEHSFVYEGYASFDGEYYILRSVCQICGYVIEESY